MEIIKRDGSLEQFNIKKIELAIIKSFCATNRFYTKENIKEVLNYFKNNFSDLKHVEEIQDAVEKSLMECGYYDVAKAYILYRKQRENIRNSKSHLTKTFNEILSIDARDNDLARENANIDGNAPMGLMLLFGSETAKDYTKRYLLDPKHAEMHDKGDFHIHDLNMYPCTFNCCHIGLKDLFEKGFSTGEGKIRTPQSIQTASALSAIIIQSNQNDMFGGQSIPTFEYDLAPYVAKTFVKRLYECIELALGIEFTDEKIKNECFSIYNKKNTLIDCVDELKSYLKSLLGDKTDYVIRKAIQMTDKDVYQSMEALIHNLNTMRSRAGAQTPFSSINYGTGTTAEQRMIIKNILLATKSGMGNHETPIFPIQVFKIKEGINANPQDPNYDLFKLACEVTSTRMYPNYLNIDVPYNLQYYRKGKPETEIATMGASRGDAIVSIKVGDAELYDIRLDHAFKIIREFTKERKDLQSRSLLKMFKDKCGVYKITHVSGKYYVGSSKDIRRRITEHRYSIRHNGKIGEIYNLNDFDTKNYKFELLEECNADDLWEVESKYVDTNDENCVNYKDPRNNGNFNSVNRDIALHGCSYSTIPQTDRSHCWYRKLKDNANVFVLSKNQWEPVRSIIFNDDKINLKMYEIQFKTKDCIKSLFLTEDHPLHTQRGRIESKDLTTDDVVFDSITHEKYSIIRVKELSEKFETYDFEVDNDMFDLNGIVSHNCRTRVIGQLGTDEGCVVNRGNIAFNTINLPRIAFKVLKSSNDVTELYHSFIEMFDCVIDESINELLKRVKFLCKKKVYNFPFLMGQKIYKGSENLGWEDSIEPALRNGTLSVGFVGLAECLKLLTGKHHGESEHSLDLGLQIVQHLRDRMDNATKETGWNFSCFATPAESTAGKFVKCDQKDFGIVEGVTDRKYYTNSFHVPVYYPITAHEKMEIEGKFHSICNAGAISYVELDGDPSQNVSVIEKLVQYSRKCGIGYFSLNFELDTCPVCGFQGFINSNVCPNCGWVEGTDPK